MHKAPTSDFTRLANLLGKADHRTFRALNLNSRAQTKLRNAQADLGDKSFDILANANMNIMDARSRSEAKTHLRQLRFFVKEMRSMLSAQVSAAEAIITARFPEADEE